MFLSHIHLFRGIAILYIVAGHCISAFDWEENKGIEPLLRMFLSNGTVFFVFIAGYMFQYLSKNFSSKKYYYSKLKSVILPYLIISLPAITYFVWFQQRESVWEGFYDNPQWLQVVYFYATGLHLAPFWFIPMITLFYFVAPILLRLDANQKAYWLLPCLILLSCYIPRGDVLQSFAHFFSVYFAGMFFSHYRKTIDTKLVLTPVLLLIVTSYISLAFTEFYLLDTDIKTFYINFLRKLILCCLILGAGLKWKFDNKVLGHFAEVSFGIFFIHSYIISVFKMLEIKWMGSLIQGDILLLFIFILGVLAICVFGIYVIRKLLGSYSRFIIGC